MNVYLDDTVTILAVVKIYHVAWTTSTPPGVPYIQVGEGRGII
jgi:hypothetical protein